MAQTIAESEKEEQRGYMTMVESLNHEFEEKSGRQRLAKTETFGCQQNENDTERIRGMLEMMGFGFTEKLEEADIVIYNTCAVRENAEQRVVGRLGILRHEKELRPDLMIAVCGCMVQQEGTAEKIASVFDTVDLIFGTHALYKMPGLLYRAMRGKKAVIDTAACDGAICEDIPVKHEDPWKAWVSVMYGCNNFCSYCVVPYVRGRERSREPQDIISEIKKLVNEGCSEITLLGQNVNSYGKDLNEKITFAELIRQVNDIEGIRRIRFMTSHPKDLSDELIYAVRDCKHVCKQLHLPFQAGSDRILKQMNRKYTKDEYLAKIQKVRQEVPGIELSTDVIVGFPTETDEDFEETLDVLRRVEFDTIFSFIYSKRKGTPAAKLDFVLSEAEIHKNFDRLLKVQNEISKRKNDEYVGRTETVLVDGVSKNNMHMLSGRCDSSKIVNFAGDSSLIGKYVDVKITESRTWSLNGVRI